ncbi:hypothetical protein [Mycolicibacterium sphagni]|uniref:Uncharacterized protein n=1 Tax=Mycolicibacterium sphagni TaxID=1786 RepID=A0A255DQN0_9MYCO|nr:hypothetical protein [Mycolicibacterium sphagni]OYN81708.1 hypothetical protein CG716_04955 [Mycolicibacterium sphagni]
MATKAELELENAKLRADLELAGKTFNEAAEDNGLCDAYDEVVEDLNRQLASGFKFPPRGTDHEVDVELVVTLGTSIKVFARTDYEAEDKARHEMDAEDVFKAAGLSDLFATLYKAGWNLDVEVG